MNDVSKKVEKSLHISQDVIAQIVTNSVNEIEGVYGISSATETALAPRQSIIPIDTDSTSSTRPILILPKFSCLNQS